MMDLIRVLVVLVILCVFVKKKFLPRLKKKGQGAVETEDGRASVMKEDPDFRILSFCSADFTRVDDLACCVEFELGKALKEIREKGCRLMGNPFPVVTGGNLLIILYYAGGTEKKEETK